MKTPRIRERHQGVRQRSIPKSRAALPLVLLPHRRPDVGIDDVRPLTASPSVRHDELLPAAAASFIGGASLGIRP